MGSYSQKKDQEENDQNKKINESIPNHRILIWIDDNVDNTMNTLYLDELSSTKLSIRCFKNVKNAIKSIKTIKFEETIIITNGKLYNEFIEGFKANLIDIYIIPRIIIFTSEQSKLKYFQNIDNLNTSFYYYGGVQTVFDPIKDFIFKQIKNKETKDENPFSNKEIKKRNRNEEEQLTFERIDCVEKLVLPLYYKSLIETSHEDEIQNYTEFIYNKYSSNKKIDELFNYIKSIPEIPKELLCKYYARLYTFESDFYQNLNKDLRENKKGDYLPFIKILYGGVKLKMLPITSNQILYRGSKISNDELTKIQNYLNNKLEDLPGAIVFSRSFLSFSQDIKAAKIFLFQGKNVENFSRVLYILEKDYDLDYSLSTHSDISKCSDFEAEKEVLFFPFSSFEIQEVKKTEENNEPYYEIKLLYLGKYQNKIENLESEIPESEFKTQMKEIGLIPEEKMENSKEVIQQYQEYKEEVDNIILENDEINIIYNVKDKNEIMIFGNAFVSNNLGICKIVFQEKEYNLMQFFNIKEFTEDKLTQLHIKLRYINNITDFSYMFHKCTRLLSIDDLYKLNLENVTNISYMFSECESLSSLPGLSEWNTGNIRNMSYLFHKCKSLTELDDISQWDTDNVVDMSFMFYNCKVLESLPDISNWDTVKVVNMSNMFSFCEQLNSLPDISKWNTKNVKNMKEMFTNCKKELIIPDKFLKN